MPHDHGVKHSRSQVNMTLDNEQLFFYFTRDVEKYNPASKVIDMLLADPNISEFLKQFWDPDPAVRYVKMLQQSMGADKPLLSETEISLYVTFVEKGELTEDEFMDNFTPIFSTLVMGAGDYPNPEETEAARRRARIGLLEEIRSQRDGGKG